MILINMCEIVSLFFFFFIEILSAAFAELLDNALDEVFCTLYIYFLNYETTMHVYISYLC